MAKPPRDRSSVGTNVYFVTASTWGGRSLLQADRMAQLFLDTLRHYRAEKKFQLHEFVIMPNHFHLLLSPIGVTLERTMQFIKGGFSFRVNKELGNAMEIWERGYIDHRIRDAGDYAKHVEYIRQNPVRAGLVSREEDYLWCSAHRSREVDPRPEGLKPPSLQSA